MTLTHEQAKALQRAFRSVWGATFHGNEQTQRDAGRLLEQARGLGVPELMVVRAERLAVAKADKLKQRYSR